MFDNLFFKEPSVEAYKYVLKAAIWKNKILIKVKKMFLILIEAVYRVSSFPTAFLFCISMLKKLLE